ncbi:MAG TPA: hypothetical protein VEF53_09385 [Patescibacteria group bacterium]|nr:hypothetical protein [Patescibacteria group bacterium]
MKNRRGIIFFCTGIVMTVILTLIITNMKTDITGLVGVNSNLKKPDVLKEQNMSEALDQQKWELNGIIDRGSYIADSVRSYDIVNFKKLNNERFEFEILCVVEDVNVVHEDLYKFNIHTSELKNNENIGIILNMTKGALNGLLANESNLPDIADDYSIIYYKEDIGYKQGEYEFGIDARGKQYYFLLENYRRSTPQGKWAVLGWSEGNVPNDWNDVLAVQKYGSTNHSSLREQEYEKFFAAYADNIYKLMEENSKLIYDMEKYHDRTYNSKNYNLVASNENLLYEEAEKVMKIEAPDKYKESHNILVKAMNIISRKALIYVKENEGYKEEKDYNNSRWYELRAQGARDIVNKAYACFEAEKQNEVFDENKYNEIEYNNRVEITRLIDKQINKHTNFKIRYAHPAVTRFNNTQYRYYADEGSATDSKRFCYTIEKDKNGKWMIVSRTEL